MIPGTNMTEKPITDKHTEYRCSECGRLTDASCLCAACSYPEERIETNHYGPY